MKSMPDNSVDLILTDPPYFKVKDEPWDNQWAKPQHFLAWLDTVLQQFARILKPNGSLYLFASPAMAARVELLMAERFDVLNSIRWHKAGGWHKKQRKEDLRTYLTPWEAVIFAEHRGADDMPKGSEGYSYQRGDLYRRIMQPLVDYLNSERERRGLSVRDIDAAMSCRMARHWFTHPTQWVLPTAANYARLRELFGDGLLEREWGELAAERDARALEFEAKAMALETLRRPFAVTAETPHTDLWTFDPVQSYAGKHPCEKPAAMLEHIITASSRPGAVVFDAFVGTGSTGIAAIKLGRSFVGCEMAERHHRDAVARIAAAMPPAANDNTPQPAYAVA